MSCKYDRTGAVCTRTVRQSKVKRCTNVIILTPFVPQIHTIRYLIFIFHIDYPFRSTNAFGLQLHFHLLLVYARVFICWPRYTYDKLFLKHLNLRNQYCAILCHQLKSSSTMWSSHIYASNHDLTIRPRISRLIRHHWWRGTLNDERNADECPVSPCTWTWILPERIGQKSIL